MCIKREKKQHMKGWVKQHTSIYKTYKYNVCQNGHKTHVQDINVSKVERKEKDTYNPHYIPQNQHSP